MRLGNLPKDRQIHGIAQDQDPLSHVLTDSGDCRPSDQCQKREYAKSLNRVLAGPSTCPGLQSQHISTR